MARWLGTPLPHYSSDLPAHGVLTMVFAVVSISVVISIVSSLCSSCHQRPKTPKSPHPNPSQQNPNPNSEFAVATAQILELKNSSTTDGQEKTVVELSPDVATHGPLPPAVLPSSSSVSSSRRRLSINLSAKLPEMMRTSRRELKQQPLDTGEDTIWKKTIILGEKNRVPSDDEDEGGVKNYRSRTPRSRPISRSNSFAQHDVGPRGSSVAEKDLNLERGGE